MDKSEIALQLTLANLDRLSPTKPKASYDSKGVEHNLAIAEEATKLYNYIFENITSPSDK